MIAVVGAVHGSIMTNTDAMRQLKDIASIDGLDLIAIGSSGESLK